MPDTFPCTSCGACCRRVHLIPDWPRKMLKSDGSCAHLTADNKCDIYETRPPVCRVDYMIGLLGIDRTLGYKLNAELCNKWMEEDGMSELRITLNNE